MTARQWQRVIMEIKKRQSSGVEGAHADPIIRFTLMQLRIDDCKTYFFIKPNETLCRSRHCRIIRKDYRFISIRKSCISFKAR